MQRILEPELMEGTAQVQAYTEADFGATHEGIVAHFTRVFPGLEPPGPVADLGCGPADVTVRFARRFPRCRIDAIDGSREMLKQGALRLEAEGLVGRVRLLARTLPDATLPAHHYGTVISNSLLHHLHDPQVLWQTVRAIGRAGACVFVADLMRPASPQAAEALVARYAEAEAPLLRRDFLHSLFAAFTPVELRCQLGEAGLHELRVDVISDRHVLIHGCLPGGAGRPWPAPGLHPSDAEGSGSNA